MSKSGSANLRAQIEKLHPAFALRAKDGGGERDRTDGLLVANQALSQLSYTPRAATDFAWSRGSVGPGTPEMRGGPR